jgi:hypothetical protein
MNRNILAFVHINKAAGTTFSHIMRRNFFLRHFDVQPLFNSSFQIFQSKDMKKILKINPFVKSIAGHNVRVFSNVSNNYPNIRYITLLRDPIKRTISHYKYNVEKHGSKLSFYEYLHHHASYNRQTRIISGTDNLDLAIHYLNKKFFLVGIVEEFDEFLILLKKKLNKKNFKLNYKRQNVGRFNSAKHSNFKNNFNEYDELIMKRNNLDIQLYRYVKEKILTKQKMEYGKSFESDIRRSKQDIEKRSISSLLLYIDYIIRKSYYLPMAKYYKNLK